MIKGKSCGSVLVPSVTFSHVPAVKSCCFALLPGCVVVPTTVLSGVQLLVRFDVTPVCHSIQYVPGFNETDTCASSFHIFLVVPVVALNMRYIPAEELAVSLLVVRFP